MGVDVVEAPTGLRRLADPALQASVERVLAQLPPGTTAATVDVGFDAQGIQVVGVVRLGRGWSVMGGFERRFAGEWSGHAQVRWSGR